MHPVVQTIQLQLPPLLTQTLVGIYCYGSLVWGDFDPDISDIDLLVVVRQDVDKELFDTLDAFHQTLEAQFPDWAGRIEIAYISATALETFKTQRSPISVISPGEPFNTKDAGLDWLINWYTIRAQSMVVYGPAAEGIIPAISIEEFRTAVRDQIGDWVDWVVQTRDSRPYQAYAILTMCRALFAVQTGLQTSKIQAANWAMEHHPTQCERITNALRWRERHRDVGEDASLTYPDAVAMVEYAARVR
ncbi:MAG: aminoglycoside adenylyltransferase domain-containing protein [Roseiflexaceae bacterium]